MEAQTAHASQLPSPKERVLATIRGQHPDKVPVSHTSFSADAAAKILGREAYVGGAFVQWREMEARWQGPEAHQAFLARCIDDAAAVSNACGHDIMRLHYWRWHYTPTKRIDEFTFLFGDPDKRWYTMRFDPELELFTREDGMGSSVIHMGTAPEKEITEDALRAMVEAAEDEAQTYTPPPGPNRAMAELIDRFPNHLLRLGGGTVAISMESMAHVLAAAEWPDLYARLLVAHAIRCAKDIPAMAAAGMQAYFSGSDFCTKDGPMVSPHLWNSVVVPALKILVDACHQHGIAYFYASDGNFWPVADAMFNVAGVDGWFELDGSASMDLRRLRERFPHVTFIGNIRSQVLHRGTKDEVTREVMDCLEVAHEMGGVVVGCSNLIMPGTPIENIMTMLDLIERNR